MQGFTGGTLTDGVSHGAFASLVAEVAVYPATTALPGSILQGARLEDMFAIGRGSAALRINLTACGNAAVPQRLDRIRIATARILLGVEYIFFSRPDL